MATATGEKSIFEEATHLAHAIMKDTLLIWEENMPIELPLTDYREATNSEAALFAFKKYADKFIGQDVLGEDSLKLANPFFKYAMKIKQLGSKIMENSDPNCKFAPDIFELLKEAPVSQLPISVMEDEARYKALSSEKGDLEDRIHNLVADINQLQSKLDMPFSQFISSNPSLSNLEIEVENLELELHRAYNNKKK